MAATRYATRQLRDVGVSLLDCEHRTPQPAPFGYPYVAIPDVRDGRLDLANVRLISASDFKSWTRKTKPQAGDIIVTRRGRVGDTAVVPKGVECAIGQNLVILRSDGRHIDQSYLRWTLRGPLHEEQVRKYLNVGAVFDSLNCADIPQFEIPVPPLPEQRAIASVLGALDDKIELNRRTNETLEAMARALFKSWFVDFDPVRAKMEGRQPWGMDAETAALFPAAFERCDGGLVPAGWKFQRLRDVTTFLRRGISPKYSDCSGIAVLNQKCIRNSRVSLDLARLHDPSKAVASEQFLQAGDVLVNSTGVGTLGRIGQLLRVDNPVIVDSHVTIVRANPDTLEPLLLGRDLIGRQDEIEALGEGSTGQTELGRERLGNVTVLVPSEPVQKSATSKLSPLLQAMDAYESESCTLGAVRDTLLPKLLSGEIRLRDAEFVVEAAG